MILISTFLLESAGGMILRKCSFSSAKKRQDRTRAPSPREVITRGAMRDRLLSKADSSDRTAWSKWFVPLQKRILLKLF